MNENLKLVLEFLLVVGGMGLIFLLRVLPHRTKGSRKELTGHATVLSRRVDQGSPVAGGGHTRWNYKVVFQVGNQELDLYVTQSQFPRLKEGITGQLTWQKENLIDFIPDEA